MSAPSPWPSWTVPVYLALTTGPITGVSTGASMPEVANEHGYARQLIPDATVDADGGIHLPRVTVTFPPATGTWGAITEWAGVDSAIHGMGTIVAWDKLPVDLVLDTGPSAEFHSTPFTLTPPRARLGLRVETFAAIAKPTWAFFNPGPAGSTA